MIALSVATASRLEFRQDFIELLPSESVGARLLRRAMARMGGGSATMFVVVQSPDAEANRRIVDALEPQLRALPPTLVRTIEHGPEEIRRFFWQRRWLFAEVGDLEEISCELQRARRRAQPGFVDLDDEPCSELRSDHGRAPSSPPPARPPRPLSPSPPTSPPPRGPSTTSARSSGSAPARSINTPPGISATPMGPSTPS
nr:hypothetical protein [Deltaproteobacteria bacterium]